MPAPVILCENAAFGYSGRIVLREVSFTLPAGAFVAVMGENGSGKSTFLRTLCGLQPLRAGVLGFDFGEAAARPPRIGFVSQRETLDDLYPFTGEDVVRAGARAAEFPGLPESRGARERASAALERAGAAGFAGRLFAELSGGQRQRVLLARALALAPDVLVLDEPVSGVDTAARLAIAETLESVRDSSGVTVFLATHDPALAGRLATHTLSLADGTATLAVTGEGNGNTPPPLA